ncbi:DUF368 domain-containing protein [Paenibacillaceae bacterium]|nr:DUF368 domain-containing protein [Paenibacillaceae bacterium]
MEWRNLWRGALMGTTDLIPGISGGTMAVILGIYHKLLEAINGLFSKEWKKHVLYLIPVGLGMVAAIFGFSRVMDWLLNNAEQPTYYFFIGLILGIIPYLLKSVDYRKTFTPGHYILLAAAVILMISFGLLRPEEGSAVLSNPSFNEYLFLFFAGWLASAALILPGVSGTFVFLLLGLYPTIIAALKDLHLPIIAVVGAGVVIGIVLTSKLVHLFLNKFTVGTYAVVIGMVLGAAIVVFPGVPLSSALWLSSIFALAAGVIVAVLLGRISHD